MSAGYKRNTPAFSDVTICVRSPGLRILHGPNGSGKSTLMEVIAGFLPLIAGTIAVSGEVTYIRHSPALVPFLTVRDNCTLYLRRYGFSPDSADRFIDGLGLQPHLDKLPSELSTGTLRKAWIVCGLLTRSGVLCLDEPFNGLDPGAADYVAAELFHQSAERLVLAVAHQPPEIITLDEHNRFADVCVSNAGFELRSARVG
ncbi:ATP-binding cassette domain-containing protein [Corynebacterium liangguodongii]|nr:ATP-binding cassette domain-containing protein [Corynebacterium liangguodongii]